MPTINQKLDVLYAKISGLSKRQEEYSEEISRLKKEIDIIKSEASNVTHEELTTIASQPIQDAPSPILESAPQTLIHQETKLESVPDPRKKQVSSLNIADERAKGSSTTQLEKFIGENLANKIGVIILILGVAIGTKYSIEHNLITPHWRIIIGYILSIVLGFFAFKLKPKYVNLSAVLASGAIAVFYLVSYSAFAFFNFFPQSVAFLLLVLSTVLSAYVATIYNRQVIAQLGLVGAYAAPFLVSTGSNNVLVLFSYIAIINLAIVFLAKKQQWAELMYSSFVFTFLIFAFWFLLDESNPNYVRYSLVFASVFFLQFHLYFLFFSKAKNPNHIVLDGLALLCNLFLFYGFVYTVLGDNFTKPDLKGIFTFGFGALLLGSSYYLHKKDESETKLSFIVAGLGVAFFVIAVPIQFEGNAIPLLWAAMGGILFVFGRIRQNEWSELFSVPVLAVAILGYISNTVHQYKVFSYIGAPANFESVFNFNFLTNILFIGAFAALFVVNRKFLFSGKGEYLSSLNEPLKFLFPSAVLFLIYYSVYLEIGYFWERGDFLARTTQATDVNQLVYFSSYHLSTIWQLIWGIFYVFILAILNNSIWKSKTFRHVNLVLGAFATLMILTMGLYTLSEIRAEYLHMPDREVNYSAGSVFGLRYLTLAIVLGYWYLIAQWSKKEAFKPTWRIPVEIGIHVILLWIICSEILHWMDINGLRSAYKASMSITSGCYALILVGLGMMQQKQHLRIMAIILFGVILVKLFIYDISSMNKLTKTIVFICLGGLLLFISYLYNKYKSKTENSTEEELPLE